MEPNPMQPYPGEGGDALETNDPRTRTHQQQHALSAMGQ